MNKSNELGDALVVEGGRHDTALSPKLALAREQWFLESRDVPRVRWRPREMLRLPKRRIPSERRTILLLRFERRAT